MANPVFEIETNGACFFCLNPNCASSSNKTKFDLTTATAIKILFRYLNIDIKKVASVSSFVDSCGILLDASTNLAVTLCESCFFLVDEFLELFQDFERIRLQLERCTWKLHEFIEKGVKDEDRVREYRTRVSNFEVKPHARFAEELRRETFEKCSPTYSSLIPRICLRRGAIYNTQRNYEQFPNTVEVEPREMPGGNLVGPVQVKVESEYQNVNTSGSDCGANDAASIISEHEQLMYPSNIKEEMRVSDTKSEDIPSDPLSVKKTKRKRKPTKKKCTKCDKWFSSNSTLKRHMRVIHNGIKSDNILTSTAREGVRKTAKAKTKCNICDKWFSGYRTRYRHIREIHSGITFPSRKLNLKCVYCSQYYSSSTALRVHQYGLHPMQMLSKVLPPGASEKDLNRALENIISFVSIDCGLSGFPTKSDGKRTCPWCAKVYFEAYRFRTHILESHKDEVCRRIQTGDRGPKLTSASGSLVPATPPTPPKIKIE